MANARQLDKKKWILQSYKNGIRKTFRGTSRAEVEKAERDWLNDLEQYGMELKKEKYLFKDIMYEHLFINVKPSVSPGTFERYMSIYNTHIINSKFGLKDIKAILQIDVQKFLNSKTSLSLKSLSMLRFLIYQSFTHAIANNLIRVNPSENIKIPRSSYNSKELEVFTLEEQEKYINVLNQSYYELFFKVALSTGMRVGELIALKWKNVDLDHNIIKVRESSRLVTQYTDSGKKLSDTVITKEPKTDAGKRDIPMHPTLAYELKKYKLNTGGSDKEYVFKNKRNIQIKYNSIEKTHKLLCQKAGIRTVKFHCLRHTFATRLIEQGIDPKTVSQLLGHTDIKITLNTYVHSTLDTKKEAIEKLHTHLNII